MDAKTAESRGHDTKTPPPSARTAEKMAPESMMEEEKRREMRSGRKPRGREEAGQSRSTLPQPTGGLLLTIYDIVRLPRYELASVVAFKFLHRSGIFRFTPDPGLSEISVHSVWHLLAPFNCAFHSSLRS